MNIAQFKVTWFFLLLFFIGGQMVPSFAQKKVKYKDLFPLLSAQKFDDAEPFLRSIIAADPDHANANFQMGLMLEHKSKQADILKETDLYTERADSAIIYYQKSKGLISEKELKKRDQYYQAFNRRDLRTGKFGIKLSDVQLDIENRINGLATRSHQIKDLRNYYAATQSYYKVAQDLYLQIQNQFEDVNDLFLRSNQDTRGAMDGLMINYDSARTNFDRYQTLLGQIDNPGYSQLFVVRDIQDFKTDGVDTADFYSDRILVWNYYNWVENTMKVIEEEIIPLLGDIVNFDAQLSSILDRVNVDSTLLEEHLPDAPDRTIVSRLLKFHQNSFMVPFFHYRLFELSYLMESSPVHNPNLLDSFHVDQQILIHHEVLEHLESADSLLNILGQVDITTESMKYSSFVTERYGGPEQFAQALEEKRSFITRELETWQISQVNWMNIASWAVNETDTIPMYLPWDTTYIWSLDQDVFLEMESRYRTLAIQNQDSTMYVSGVVVGDTSLLSGFFAKVLRSREIQWVQPLAIDSLLSGYQDSLQVHFFVYDEPNKTVMFHTMKKPGEEAVNSSFGGAIAKLDENGVTLWSLSMDLAGNPKSFEYDTLQKQTVVNLKVESAGSESGHYDLQELRLDEFGKLVE